jgi:alkylresorcinol/alkylpyrone synthase
MTTGLLGLATALPENEVRQVDAAAFAEAVFSDRFSGCQRMARVVENAGILGRHFAPPLGRFAPHGWEERNAVYLEGASDLFVAAARRQGLRSL